MTERPGRQQWTRLLMIKVVEAFDREQGSRSRVILPDRCPAAPLRRHRLHLPGTGPAAAHLPGGAPWPGHEQALRTVIACWDLHTPYQVGKPVTDVTEHPRKPSKARADRHGGIVDDGTVNDISLRHRSSAAPRPRDGQNPTGRPLDYRQPVGEPSKNHCMNPPLHATGECEHADITRPRPADRQRRGPSPGYGSSFCGATALPCSAIDPSERLPPIQSCWRKDAGRDLLHAPASPASAAAEECGVVLVMADPASGARAIALVAK
ncbi:hypothetical protein ACIGO6_37895 [Streptomyces sp. NPDC053750]|uniref:hypothetical protein n=1 Tax=Streptomyces sp. NPDC053750 TaxID=3365714 RepID=UPI0037CF18F0